MVLSTEILGQSASEADFGQAVLNVAASRSPEELGETYHREIKRLIGSPSVGIYALAGGRPKLVFSREAAEGFLSDYGERASQGDILVDRMCEERRAIDGYTALGDAEWRSSGRFELMRRWGYAHCMGGPLCVDGRVVGVIYTASARQEVPYGESLLQRMNVLCRAGSIALDHMFEAGLVGEDSDGAWSGRACPQSPLMARLPSRSREVAKLVLRGQSNKEIARALNLSVHTVKEYVGNLCKRVAAQNRTELAHRLLVE